MNIDDYVNFRKPRFAIKDPIALAWRKLWKWEPLYWLRCHTIDRYHIINLSGVDDYKWGWLDRDHAMFMACFKLLEEYMELEQPYNIICYDNDMDTWNELFELYWWWKGGRKMERDACDKFFDEHQMKPRPPWPDPDPVTGLITMNDWLNDCWDDTRNHDIWFEWYTALDAKEQTQLERLIKIRRTLWT